MAKGMHALDLEAPADLTGDGRRNRRRPVRRSTCCKCLRDVLIVATSTLICLTVAIAIMSEQTMWTRQGVTDVAPWGGAAALMVAVVVSKALILCVDRRRELWASRRGLSCCRWRPGSAAAARLSSAGREVELWRRLARAGWRSLVECCRLSLGLAIGLALFVAGVLMLRAFNVEHLDDVHPDQCEYLADYLTHRHRKFLWVIPLHDDVPITSNASWCAEMRRLVDREGLLLGMHGVRHASDRRGLREFEQLPESDARIALDEGIALWRACFHASPAHFSFPGQWGSKQLVRLLRDEYSMEVRSLADGMLQKVFHCDDSFCGPEGFWFCANWFNVIW